MKKCNYLDKLSIQSKAAIGFMICGILQKGIQVITTPFFTRLLTTAQYGKISVYLSWYNISAILITLNLYQGGFNNGMLDYENDRDKYLSSMQTVVISISVVEYFIYILFAKKINHLTGMNTIMTTCMFLEVVFNSAVLFWMARARYEYRYKALLKLTIPVTLIPPFISIVSLLFFPREYGAEVKIFSNAFAVCCISLPVLIYNLKKGSCFFSHDFWEFALCFNIPLIPHYLSVIVLNQSDRIMIQRFIGDSEAGVYSLAYSCSMIFSIITSSINQSLSPWIYKKIKERDTLSIYNKMTKIFIWVALLIFLMSAVAPEFIGLFGGRKYMDAVSIFPVVSASVYFLFVYQIFANLEFFFKKKYYIAFASVAGAVVNIVLNYLFIPMYGYKAAGYTTLFCYIIFAVCHFIFAVRIEKRENLQTCFEYGKILFIGFLLCLFSLGMQLLYNYLIVRYFVLLIIGFIVLLNVKSIISVLKGQ